MFLNVLTKYQKTLLKGIEFVEYKMLNISFAR